MRRIKSAGIGFIKLDNRLINLKDFKSVGPIEMGYDEDPDGQSKFAIAFTPSTPSAEDIQNNVDGTWLVTYKEKEKKDFEADCKMITSATKDHGSTLMWLFKYIAIPLFIGLILLAIEYGWFVKLFRFLLR